MGLPNLKRVKVTSEQGLRAWLTQHSDHAHSVMLVTCTEASGGKHVSREQVQDALAAHGWTAGFRYTLNDGLLGHVISKP